MKFKLRIANAAFWIAVWLAAAYWTGVLGNWGAMALEGLIPLMLWMFIHIALRTEKPEA